MNNVFFLACLRKITIHEANEDDEDKTWRSVQGTEQFTFLIMNKTT